MASNTANRYEEGTLRENWLPLPPKLLRDLDQFTKVMGYEERSRTIQMAVRSLIAESELKGGGDALAGRHHPCSLQS